MFEVTQEQPVARRERARELQRLYLVKKKKLNYKLDSFLIDDSTYNQDIANLKKQIDRLERLKSTKHVWSKPQFLHEFSVKYTNLCSKAIGVYMISYHKEDNVIPMYIGEGVVSRRIKRHSEVFFNEGEPIVYVSGASSGSHVASKMWRHDPDPMKWSVSVIDAATKTNAEIIESYLVQKMQPAFNSSHMCKRGIYA